MIKVITYGTYDFLHYGHIRLLERAKALGDYLIVGVTADDFDKTRGKINVQQSLMERIEAVRATGIADEIIIEEYEGQKIDDIRRYDVDIFTVGSDWEGKFDYLNEFCKVVYLPRTQSVSSTDIRAEKCQIRFGLVGGTVILEKYRKECGFVNGIEVAGAFRSDQLYQTVPDMHLKDYSSFEALLMDIDALYIVAEPEKQYNYIKTALMAGKHVLCESPIALKREECQELLDLAKSKNLVLMEAIKTAYATAYNRLLLLVKSGAIGDVVSVDATCTSLNDLQMKVNYLKVWNSMFSWGPTAMLPIFQILGTDYREHRIVSHFYDEEKRFDLFTKIDFVYEHAVASLKIGKGVKSEGELVISGTKGYIYVPSPWWKTDYFEIRFENPVDNKRYFYQLEGEGIRYELVAFVKAVERNKSIANISEEQTLKISEIMDDFVNHRMMTII